MIRRRLAMAGQVRERDWDEAVMWHDQREPGVSHRLNIAIREVLHTLARQPERFFRATRLTHKAKVPRPWPYSVYQIRLGRITIEETAEMKFSCHHPGTFFTAM